MAALQQTLKSHSQLWIATMLAAAIVVAAATMIGLALLARPLPLGSEQSRPAISFPAGYPDYFERLTAARAAISFPAGYRDYFERLTAARAAISFPAGYPDYFERLIER